MAQLIDLGKIRFSYLGEWSNSTTYEYNDVVKYGGNLYSYSNVTASNANLPTNTTYWSLMLRGFDFQGEWASDDPYQIGHIVTYGGKVYLATSDTLTTDIPGTSIKWSQLSDGIQYEGTYASGTAYQKNDVVKYGGRAYIAKSDTTGNAPNNSLFWDIFVDGIQYEGEYDNGTAYQVNDVVSYGGIVYIAKLVTTGNLPTNTTYWNVLVEGFDYKGEYDNGTAYKKNDVVNYGGSTYVALSATTGNNPLNTSFWSPLADGTYPNQAGNGNKLLTTNGSATSWTDSIELAGTAHVDGLVTIGPDADLFVSPPESGAVQLYNPALAIVFDNGEQESSYAQVAFTNKDATSSTDIIAYMDNGNTDEGWIGMGISGSQFDDAIYGITGPGDGYIFHNAIAGSGDSGNIVIATGANGTENKLIFAAGGFDSGLTQMEITPGVNVHVEIPTPSTSPTTGAFTVVGGVGIQGDMNIQGDVDIVGTISFGGSGTTVTTQNLAVSDPVIFAGSNNLSDAVDLGLVGEYAEDVVDQITSVNNKSLTDNVATLTTTTNHGYSVGDVVVISGVDATFNGTYIITATPALNTFRYAKTAGNVSSTAVSPVGTATVTHERRWAGVVRDISDGATIKFFQGLTNKPTNTVDFANPNLTFAPVRVGNLTTENITSSTGTIQLGGTVNITSAANFTGANITLGSGTWSGAPTFSGNLTFSGAPIFSGNPSFTGTPSFTGGLRVQELIEDVVDVALSSNAATLDYQSGNIFYLSNTPSGAMTFNVTNAPTTDGRVFTVNTFVTQGSTGYVPTTMTVNGSGVTIKWLGGTTPTATSSSGKIDVFNFTIIRRSGAFTVLGSANLNF